jgi:hypothetical protein
LCFFPSLPSLLSLSFSLTIPSADLPIASPSVPSHSYSYAFHPFRSPSFHPPFPPLHPYPPPPPPLFPSDAIDNPTTFDRVPTYWLPTIRSLGVNVPVILIGNKIDLREGRVTNQGLEDGASFSCSCGLWEEKVERLTRESVSRDRAYHAGVQGG